MTMGQFFALLSACFALDSAAAYVSAIRSPRDIFRTARVIAACLIAVAAIFIGVLAVAVNRIDASRVHCPACVYHAPDWVALMMAALLVLSLCALGYAIVRRPRPTA